MKFNRQKLFSLVDLIIPAVFIISVFECYFGIWRIATLVKFCSMAVSVLMLLKGYFKRTNSVFTLFFVMSLLSPIAYLYNGRPLACLYNDMMNTIPAMLLFLIGVNDNRENRRFYDLMMYVGAGVLLLGIVCYVLTPGWYTNSLLEARNASQFASFEYTEDSLLDSLRFSSFFEDSYPVSLLSVYILSISLFNYFRIDRRLKYSALCVFISFISAILCMHRVSIASAVLIVLAFTGYECIKGRGKKIIRIVLAVVVITVISSIFSDTMRERLFSLHDMLVLRTEDMSFSSAYNERQGLSNKLMDQWSFPIFGHGIGSGGPTSRFMGYGGVTDAAYTKLLFENGIMGVMLFISLILSSIFRGLNNLKYYIVELSIICFVALAMTGSNTLSIAYLYILPFWYMMGRIWNKSYLKNAKENNIMI